MITEQFLQQKLSELIYDLGERDFNCITKEFWDNHINHNNPFAKNQIECFKMFVSDLLADLNGQKSLKLPPIIDVLNMGKL